MADFQRAIRDLDEGRRLVKEGLVLIGTPDSQGLDGPIDNSPARERGREQVRHGELVIASAEERIARINARREQLRELLRTRDRLVELESRDGRKGMFAVEAVTLPLVSLVRPDLTVVHVPIDQFTPASKQSVLRFAPPADIVVTSSFGGRLFPVLERTRRLGAANLPPLLLRFRVRSPEAGVASTLPVAITVTSADLGLRAETRAFEARFGDGKATDLEFPLALPGEFPAVSGGVDVAVDATVRVAGGREDSVRIKLRLHGTTEVPLAIREADGRILDTRELVAALVDENLPDLAKVSVDLASTGWTLPEEPSGEARAAAVRTALATFWQSLSQRGLTFGDGEAGSFAGNEVLTQVLRPAGETMQSTRATGSDAAVLFASFALHTGLEPVLAVRPGRVLLGIRTGGADVVVLDLAGLGVPESPGSEPMDAVLAIEGAEQRARELLAGARVPGAPRAGQGQQNWVYLPGGTDFDQLRQEFRFVELRGARAGGILPHPASQAGTAVASRQETAIQPARGRTSDGGG